MIAFRKQHPVIRKDLEPSYTAYPAMSSPHPSSETAPSNDSHICCILFAGFDETAQKEDLVFLAVNTHWFSRQLTLPPLPEGYIWKIAVNTGDPVQQTFQENDMPTAGQNILLGERSVILFVGTKTEAASQ